MTNSPYIIHIKTPSGQARITADTWDGLVQLMPDAMRQAGPGSVQEDKFEARLNAFYEAYRKRFGVRKRQPSPIESHGLELEIVACFLHRMTINQTIEYLVTNKSFRVSKSALGRYWTRFVSLGHRRDALKLC